MCVRQLRANAEDDEQLEHTLRTLREVHAMYYQELDEEEKKKASSSQGAEETKQQQQEEEDEDEDFLHDNIKNVADCLARVRARVLRGCSIVFSGVIPRGLGIDARRSDYGQMAETLGAVVTDDLTDLTTHLVAENQSTEKVYHASRRPNISIVTLRWLQLSYLHCHRKKEGDFPLLKPVASSLLEPELPSSKKIKVAEDGDDSNNKGAQENENGKEGSVGGEEEERTSKDEEGEGNK